MVRAWPYSSSFVSSLVIGNGNKGCLLGDLDLMLKLDYRFNPTDPELLRDPYPVYEYLRDTDPVHWAKDGYWVVTGYADTRAILINKEFGQGDFVKNIQLFYDADFDVLSHASYAWLSRVFVMQDPPDHTRLRGLVSQALSLKRIRIMETGIR